MSDEDTELSGARQAAFAALTEVGRLTEAGRTDEAAAAARGLGETVAARPDDASLAGFATMALDAALWLVGGGADADARGLCDTLIARLDGGDEAARAVVAGARFLAAQAEARLGEPDRARAQLAALSEMGEPALAGLERMAGRLATAGAAPAWHAQLAAATVGVLWRLGRVQQAQAFARETAASFSALGESELAAGLTALARELGGSEAGGVERRDG